MPSDLVMVCWRLDCLHGTYLRWRGTKLDTGYAQYMACLIALDKLAGQIASKAGLGSWQGLLNYYQQYHLTFLRRASS